MVKELTYGDKAAILAYAYRKERENIFIIQALESGENEDKNRLFGIEEGGALRAVGMHFGMWNSMTANGSDTDVRMIADEVARLQLKIEAVPAFRQYAMPLMEQLRTHNLEPHTVSDEIVYELTPDDLATHETTDVRAATAEDADVCGRFDRQTDLETPATETERQRANWERTVVLEIDGTIVAKANLHGRTKRYAQIGGVFTHPDHRGKGYAKRCVTALCERCFADGTETMLLFADTTNLPARAVYEKLGFRPVDRWVIAEY